MVKLTMARICPSLNPLEEHLLPPPANQVILSGRLDDHPTVSKERDGRDQVTFHIEKHAVTVIEPSYVATARDLRAGDPVFVQGHLESDITVNELHEYCRQTRIIVDKTRGGCSSR